MLRAGTLNSRVTIQRPGRSQNGIGQPVPAPWVDVVTVWANIRTVSGREFISGAAANASVTVSIRMRYRSDVTPEMRVLHRSSVYEVVAVLPDEQRREHVDLACRQLVNLRA